MRRHERATFGGAYVFPGGVVDASDHAIDRQCVDIDPADASRRLGLGDDALGYYVAAIRELFEETGVLLADSADCAGELRDARRALNGGELDWNRFVAANRLTLACSALCYFSHWITPDVMPKRYSTRFFLVRMPAGQYACHDDGELTDAMWMTAGEALRAAQREELSLHFPTRTTIEQLARRPSVGDLEDWAMQCERRGVVAIQPVMPGGSPTATPEIRYVASRHSE